MAHQVAIGMQCLEPVAWISEASAWQLPARGTAPSQRDAFMLGGNGRVSARMGMQSAYSTIDRFMGPEYDSYGVRQNNYFRKTRVGVSVEHPHECITERQRLWRVPGTTIMCTTERVRAQHEAQVLVRDIEIATINFVLTDQTALLRLIAVKNASLCRWMSRLEAA